MAEFYFSKLFPRDVNRPTVQKDVSMYTHIAQISGVDTKKGTCSVRWITPKPGYRSDVLITHGSPGDVTMPSVGDYVLVTFDPHEQARIVGYINLGHQTRVVTEQTLPELEQGEKFYEVSGAYLWIRKNGDIFLTTPTEGFIQLENSSSTLRSETINWRVSTEAGINYSGIIRRVKALGVKIENITRLGSTDVLTEHRLKVVETSDLKVSPTGLSDPLIDICLGTYVDDEGIIVNKKDESTLETSKELAVRISFQSGLKLLIDKEGRVSIEGAKLNINNASVDSDDPDVSRKLELNDSTKGTVGQKVARTHDTVTIPIGSSYTDESFRGLESKNSLNLATLATLASAFISPAGPCSLNSAVLGSNLKLEGLITEGAENVYIGG